MTHPPEDDPWRAILGSSDTPEPAAPRPAASSSAQPGADSFPTSTSVPLGAQLAGRRSGRPSRRGKLIGWLVAIVVILALVGTAAGVGWAMYGDRIQAFLAGPPDEEFEGDGTTEVLVTIEAGDIGSDVGDALQEAGVILSSASFYEMLIGLAEQPVFTPGTYSMKLEMSNAAALAAVTDPANIRQNTVTIPEGSSYERTLELLSAGTGIPLEDFEAAVEKPRDFGIPKAAPSVEGYLFPATYDFQPDATATSIIQTMVDRMAEELESEGVEKKNWHEVLTLASIIQRESGPVADDFYKVSRVFHNRIDEGWNLESDATVAYGTGNYDTPFTTEEERADTSNPYNTYANPGLPVGPIGAPGALAIDAALHPVDGPWFFFVTVDFRTGETVFSETFAEHQAAVAKLQQFCAEPDNAELCG